MTFLEKVYECDKLKTEIFDRAKEILVIAVKNAPKYMYSERCYKSQKDPNQLEFENFVIYKDHITLYYKGYTPSLLGIDTEHIKFDWLNLSDKELSELFQNLENDWEEKDKDRLQKKAKVEKDERRKQYQKLKEEFENESSGN